MLISEYTYNYVSDRVEAIQVGSRQFKGKQKEVMVYEILSMRAGIPLTVAPPNDASLMSTAADKLYKSLSQPIVLKPDDTPAQLSPLASEIRPEDFESKNSLSFN